MRAFLVLAALPIAVLAGCLENQGDLGEEKEDVPAVVAPPALPKDIKETKMVPAGQDVLTFLGEDPCSTTASACYRYPFEVAAGNDTNQTHLVNASISLKWNTDANDFDVLLYKGSAQVAASAGGAPGTNEALARDLAPGKYTIVVVAWLSGPDSYTLEAKFARPAAAPAAK